ENKPPAQEGVGVLQTLSGGSGGDENDKDPQEELKQGTIPDGFLRQMFYTLGDYRDILVRGGGDTNRGDKDVTSGSSSTNNIVLLASGDKQDEMKKIQKAIDEYIKSLKQAASGTQQQTEREKWWETYAESIWNGMIYALTYKTDTPSGKTTITQDEGLKDALLDKDGKKPKSNPHDYTYEGVKLEEDSGAKPTKAAAKEEPTTLKNFVLRPPYFRYLEEWGETFCRERTRRLAKIRGECMEEDGTQKYSGDGEDCEDIFSKQYNVLQDLSSSCAKPCSSYRRWIERKGKEFEKQEKAYEQQKENCEKESEGGVNGVCGTVKTSTTAAAFLDRLKNGPCKIENESAEGNEKDKLDFSKPNETFVPAANCAPCSKFTAKLEKCNCTGANANTCNGGRINAENIKTSTADIGMLVSGKSTKGFEVDELKEACGGAGIFEGIKENKWICSKVCGLDVCKPKEGNGAINAKHIVQIKALVKRWLEYFLEDYNEIKRKISHCINNGKGNICKNKCNDKCNCVDKWITKKRTEWENIKNRYVSKNERENPDSPNTLTNFLETFTTEIAAATDKREHSSLQKLEKSLGCNCTETSEKKADEKNIIDCMLEKLGEKAKKCAQNHAPTSGSDCNTAPTSDTTLDDEEDLLLEEEENPVTQPGFCPKLPKPPPQPEKEDACKPAPAPAPAAGGEGKQNPEQTHPPKPLAPSPEAPPAAPLAPADQPFDPTILQTTIPFGIALALTSIAFLYLK
ncbi:hypothetical protein PFMC_06052, partial [Plasmodium falciparum CAMP/Malaysia]